MSILHFSSESAHLQLHSIARVTGYPVMRTNRPNFYQGRKKAFMLTVVFATGL